MQDLTPKLAVAMIAGSSLLISVNGLMLRSIEAASPWQVIFARQAFFVITLITILAFRYGRGLPSMFAAVGWPGVLGGLSLAFANTGFVLAMSYTTVANTLFTLSAAPLITAVIARVFLRERIAGATVIAIGIAMVGIAIMLGEGLSRGSVAGTVIALATALCFSLFVIFLRLGKDRNMLPTSVIGASVAGLIGLVGSGFDLQLSTRDLGICLVWGAGIVCAVHVMFTVASRYVPSAEIMLITLIEFTLGPVWVWLVFGEKPSVLALVGGLLVLGAVAGRTLGLFIVRPR